MNGNAPRGPYVGLVPYTEEDWEFFFGRSAETEIIIANLIAARLTVLYGASGVGKSSVLRAGVAHEVGTQARQNRARNGRPGFAIAVFNSWHDEPMAPLAQTVRQAVAQALGCDAASLPQTAQLADTLRAYADLVGGPILVVLDQFEEYFLYHAGWGSAGTFESDFPGLVTAPDLPVNFLLGIREDALAHLDRFKGRIPNLFTNYLRLRHMGLQAAEEALRQPLLKYNEHNPAAPVSIEQALVERVLQETSSERAHGVAAPAMVRGGEPEPDGPRIETPYLQMVMTRLWEKEDRPGPRTLRLATLVDEPPAGLGGVERIVRTHLDEKMGSLDGDQQRIAAQAFRFLVTRSGTKVGLAVEDLAEHTAIPAERLEPVLQQLAAGERRILRAVPVPGRVDLTRYEIFHDVLGQAVTDWRRRYEAFREVEAIRSEQEQRRAEELRMAEERRRRDRARYLKAGVWALSLALVLLASVTALALRERSRALLAKLEAQQEAIAARDAKAAAQREAADARFARQLEQQAATQAETVTRASISARDRAPEVSPGGKIVGARLRDAFLRGDNAAIETTARSVDRLNETARFLVGRVAQNYTIQQGQVYEFTMRPVGDTIVGGLPALAAVSFKMNHPTFRNRVIVADRQRDFRASYIGWGCLASVPVLLEYVDPGRSPDIAIFDMCDAIVASVSVAARAIPKEVQPGGSVLFNVVVTTNKGMPVANARVTVSAGGGVFDASDSTSVSGTTDDKGMFSARWHTYEPSRYAGTMSYVMDIRARTDDFGEASAQVEVVVRR